MSPVRFTLSLIGELAIICFTLTGPLMCISIIPIRWEFRLSISIILILCYCCCCRSLCRSRNKTVVTQSGNRTITRFDEFNNYDSNMLSVVDMGSVVERSNSSSSTHVRTNNCEIPTISRPVLVDFSLHRQTSLHRPQWDFELVYDQNLVSVSATETKIRFRYQYRSLNFFYLNRNFFHFLFPKLFSCFLCLFLNIFHVIQSYHVNVFQLFV